jgi:hypothetical protein
VYEAKLSVTNVSTVDHSSVTIYGHSERVLRCVQFFVLRNVVGGGLWGEHNACDYLRRSAMPFTAF